MEMNMKLFSLLARLDGAFRRVAVYHLPEPEKSREVVKMLDDQVSEGQLKHAQETVKFFNRELTVKELEKIYKKQKKDKYYANAIKTACAFPEMYRISALDEIRELCLEYGDVDSAKAVSDIQGRLLTVCELEILLKVQYKKEWYGNVEKTMELFPEPFRTKKLTEYYKKEMECPNLHTELEAAKFLNLKLTVERLEFFMNKYIEEGCLYLVKEVKTLLNRELSSDELERLLAKLIVLRQEHNANEVFQMIGRRPTFDELKRLHAENLFSRYHLNIENVEKLIGRKLKLEELIEPLELFIKENNYGDAMNIAKHILGLKD